jgi:hypothetical protein
MQNKIASILKMGAILFTRATAKNQKAFLQNVGFGKHLVIRALF